MENEPLTEKEKKELEMLDNPNIKSITIEKYRFIPPVIVVLFSIVMVFSSFLLLIPFDSSSFSANILIIGLIIYGNIVYFKKDNIIKRRERVVKLRTKMRLYELQIDSWKNRQKYHEIVKEEEKRFNERFKI